MALVTNSLCQQTHITKSQRDKMEPNSCLQNIANHPMRSLDAKKLELSVRLDKRVTKSGAEQINKRDSNQDQ